MKKIINIACAVIILLYSWLSAMYCTPGPANSNLISTEKAVPTNPENKAKIRYNVPISLALQDKNHLSVHIEIFLMKYTLHRLKLVTRKLILKYQDLIDPIFLPSGLRSEKTDD
jgi:hypothetical protein